jgi:hypothetical protein
VRRSSGDTLDVNGHDVGREALRRRHSSRAVRCAGVKRVRVCALSRGDARDAREAFTTRLAAGDAELWGN